MHEVGIPNAIQSDNAMELTQEKSDDATKLTQGKFKLFLPKILSIPHHSII
jgi:hypothetical protein